MNRWSVHVKQFGKIEEATVEVTPMTLFIGDNNSGKSYMMTLIYGLLNVRFYFDKYVFDKDSQNYQQCCKILERMISEEIGHTYILCGKEMRLFQALINEILAANKEKFLKKLFNKDMDIGEIAVSFPDDLKMRFMVSNEYDIEEKIPQGNLTITEILDDDRKLLGYIIAEDKLKIGDIGYPFFLSYIMESMLQGELDKGFYDKRIYLPTARTGFLLTYKTLIGNALQEKFTMAETTKNLLTKPNSDFLQELSGINATEEKKRFQSVVEFIEEHVITGHVSVLDSPAQDLVYTPEGTDKKLPLYITSGVVTEMTPLLLFLKYTDLGALLMEEPEICLHPHLQWQVTRVLIRLANMGVPVFVTTHSDIILQHINNMIKANEMPKQEAFLKESDYEKEDLLSRDQINVYQFDVQENQKTKISKLPCGDFGFEAMTFYDTLQKLNQEIGRIENEG